jgi:UDP-N-acetylglucosamine--dolichyl-phosphate N-acetylglucosaminephosphotransferase
MNKPGKPIIAEMGGLAIIAGFCAALLPAIAISSGYSLAVLLAVISCALLVALIGVLDDVLGWKRGLKQWQHALLPAVAASPLIAIKAGNYSMNIPLIGMVDFGLLYPLIIIPVALTGAANAVNMLGGLNGLQAGLGFVISAFLIFAGLIIGDVKVVGIAAALAGSLLAFLYYNWCPARIFPGDIGTLGIGAIIASIAIIGNIEKFVLGLFLLFFIEFAFKMRSKFRAMSWGKLRRDGTLKPMYKSCYSLTHLIMKAGRFRESHIVLILLTIQTIIGLLALKLLL